MSNLTEWIDKCHELEKLLAAAMTDRKDQVRRKREGKAVLEKELFSLRASFNANAELHRVIEKDLRQRIADLDMENTHLRVKAQKVGCPYNNTHPDGTCKSGYPGCACMDDYMAIANFGPGDEDRALVRARAQIDILEKYKERLHWLHWGSGTDPEGYEWGVYRVKWENGVPISVLHTCSDLSDLDAEIDREEKEKSP